MVPQHVTEASYPTKIKGMQTSIKIEFKYWLMSLIGSKDFFSMLQHTMKSSQSYLLILYISPQFQSFLVLLPLFQIFLLPSSATISKCPTYDKRQKEESMNNMHHLLCCPCRRLPSWIKSIESTSINSFSGYCLWFNFYLSVTRYWKWQQMLWS